MKKFDAAYKAHVLPKLKATSQEYMDTTNRKLYS